MNSSVFSSMTIAAFSPWKRNFEHTLMMRVEQVSPFNEFNETYFVFAGYLGDGQDHSRTHQGLVKVIRGSLERCLSLLLSEAEYLQVYAGRTQSRCLHTGVTSDLINLLC